MKIVIINGPNLNFLNKRNHQIYGGFDLPKIEELITKEFDQIKIEFFQSDDEGTIIDKIHHAPNYFDGLIINPGGFSHSSIAIRDALEICTIPKVEVHLSNISSRETFRRTSITASVCDGYISGLKHISYLSAVYTIIRLKLERS
ncbi:MAG: 3-dehydroquinate dehydratase [Ignavibacteria bacterium]|nr:3-dehydroquinate dehydratase [Ignavibacteria bacterium]